MHLFHKWGPWSSPIDVTMKLVKTGALYTAWRQRRSCQTCGYVDEREIY